MVLIAIFICLVFLYSLGSRLIEKTVLTPPILFTVAGFATFLVLRPAPQPEIALRLFLRLAEITLVLILFVDASRTDLGMLRSLRDLPVRLLTTGLLLTIVLGTLLARVVFPGLSLAEAGILGAILAPTDAGLGQQIVSSPRVPARIRQALNVEAGLNDGLAVPFLMFFIALAEPGGEGGHGLFARFVVEQLGFGTAIGVAVGLVGGRLLGEARARGWMAPALAQIGLIMLPLLAYVACGAAGASAFIAAFVAGLAVHVGLPDAGEHSVEFTEEWGQLLGFLVFFLFGFIVGRRWSEIGPAAVLYAVLSLTVIRMLPVAIALLRTGFGRPTVCFMGWFGPRGLASIVLGLVYLEQEANLPGEPVIRVAVMTTVLLSILAHGLSAAPGIDRYARRLALLPGDAPERAPADVARPGVPL